MTEEQIQFIKDNRLTMHAGDLASEIGLSRDKVCKYMRQNGLKVSRDIMNKILKSNREKPKKFTFNNTKEFWCRNWLVG